MAPSFLPGLELSRLFYLDVVRPLLDAGFPGLQYSAALVGPGSEVLGYDSPRSADHDWGPRLLVFLAGDAATELAPSVLRVLAARLPAEFRGYRTAFPASGAPSEPARHRVTVTGLSDWLRGQLGFDPAGRIEWPDWLSAPTQVLAEITGGAVFHDGLAGPGRAGLADARTALAWYPHDVWLYVLACQWNRIAQEEAFPGRCAEAGDELGSAVVTARLVREVMRLVLLMERRYPPYSKWLGTAFAGTTAGPQLRPVLMAALAATSWPDRQRYLSAAYEATARLHNKIAVTPAVDPAVRPTYYDRPYRVIEGGRFVRALLGQIRDERIRGLPLTGSADQIIDSTDGLGQPDLLRATIMATITPG